MSTLVKLSQKQTIQLYCHLRSCERATFALEPGLLAEFVEYHDAEKVLKIGSFADDIQRWAATAKKHPVFSTAHLRRFVSIFSRAPFGAYHFEAEVLLRSKAALDQFNRLKACPYVSNQKMELQEELAVLRDWIERQSGILRWHPAANEVDHFYRTLTRPAFTIEELLEKTSPVLYKEWNDSVSERGSR